MSNQSGLKPADSRTCFLHIRSTSIVSLDVVITRLDSSLLKEDSEGWELFVFLCQRASCHLCLFVTPRSQPGWGSWILKSKDLWGRWHLGFRVRAAGSVISPLAGVLFHSSFSMSRVGFNRGFFPLPRLHVPRGHDLGLRVRSQMSSVGGFFCFRHVQYVIESSC